MRPILGTCRSPNWWGFAALEAGAQVQIQGFCFCAGELGGQRGGLGAHGVEFVDHLAQAVAIYQFAHPCAIEGVGGADFTRIEKIERSGQVAQAVASDGDRVAGGDLASAVKAIDPGFHVVDLAEGPAQLLDLEGVGPPRQHPGASPSPGKAAPVCLGRCSPGTLHNRSCPAHGQVLEPGSADKLSLSTRRPPSHPGCAPWR